MGKQFTIIIIFILLSSINGISADIESTNLSVDQNEQTITYALPYGFGEFSYYTAKSYTTDQWISAVYAGLYARDSDNDREFSPNLAKGKPTVSSDGLTWTIDLKPDLKFSTGYELTADDVAFSYKVALTSAINTNSYDYLSRYFESADAISVIDVDTVEFTLSQKYAFAMTLFEIPIIDQSHYQSDYDDCINGVIQKCDWDDPSGEYTISAGPFFVETIDTTNMVVTLVKNEHYWNADTVMAEKLIFEKTGQSVEYLIDEVNNGEIDIMDSQFNPSIDAFDGETGISQDIIEDLSSYEITINHLNSYWGTGESIPGNTGANATAARYVRKAMSHMVDREGFVTDIFNGLARPASTSMPSTSLGWNPSIEPRQLDLATARSMMEDAGFDYSTLGAEDGVTNYYQDTFFNITVLVPNTNPYRESIASAFADELPKIGIGVDEFVSSSWTEIIPRTLGSNDKPLSYDEGGFDILFINYRKADLDWDPTGRFDDSGLCSTGDCSNFINYDNTTVATLVNEYTSSLGITERYEKVNELQHALYDDLPVIPIVYPQFHWAWGENVTGIDTLLVSVGAQEWGEVAKSDWTTLPSGETLTRLSLPRISTPILTPDDIVDINTTTVTVNIDSLTNISDVVLSYKINNEEFTDVTMTSSDNITYEVSISGFDVGDTVTYKIYASNVAGTSVTADFTFEVKTDETTPEADDTELTGLPYPGITFLAGIMVMISLTRRLSK